MNYEKDIAIEPDALDVCWLEQPNLMRKYTRHSALMQKRVDEAKEKLELVKAELDKEIRSNPSEYDLEKVTENVILATILVQEKYQTATTEFIEAKFELNVAKGAVDAVEHRKAALENLVRLYTGNYFAGPSVPRNITKDWEEHELQKSADTKVGTMKRKSKE